MAGGVNRIRLTQNRVKVPLPTAKKDSDQAPENCPIGPKHARDYVQSRQANHLKKAD